MSPVWDGLSVRQVAAYLEAKGARVARGTAWNWLHIFTCRYCREAGVTDVIRDADG